MINEMSSIQNDELVIKNTPCIFTMDIGLFFFQSPYQNSHLFSYVQSLQFNKQPYSTNLKCKAVL